MEFEELLSQESFRMGEAVNLLAFEDTEEYRAIRGHIMIERLLDQLLAAKLMDYDRLLNKHRVYFDLKVDLGLSLGLVGDSLAEALHTLNRIRNKLSHQQTPDISMEEIKKLDTRFFSEPMFRKALEVVYEKGYKDSLVLSTLFLYWEVGRLVPKDE